MKKIAKNINQNKKAMIIISIVFSIFILYHIFSSNMVQALSKYGSRGNEVTQIQTKLKRWGYYNGSIDGIYGSQTLAAVKYFQRKNGLTADGIYNSSGNSSGSTSNSSNLNLLSHLVYAEARGEPYAGQVAVAAVVLNRVKNSNFPNTVAGVIYQSGAFDAVSDGQINLSPNDTAKKAAQDALNGWDPAYGSIYYFNPATATNKWIWSRPYVITIGKHRFCK